MSRFLSGIAFKNGDIHYNPITDSHEDLIQEKELDDRVTIPNCNRNWVRFEYTSETLSDLSTYVLEICEEEIPIWVDSKFQYDLVEKLKLIISSIILCDVNKKFIIGGCWILTGNTLVNRCVCARVVLMDKNSKINNLDENSEVNIMSGYSKIVNMKRNSKIRHMMEFSEFFNMYSNSNIYSMWDNSKGEAMYENSKICRMRDSSRVTSMYDNSKVYGIFEDAKILKNRTKQKDEA